MTIDCEQCGFAVDPAKETSCPCGHVDLDGTGIDPKF